MREKSQGAVNFTVSSIVSFDFLSLSALVSQDLHIERSQESHHFQGKRGHCAVNSGGRCRYVRGERARAAAAAEDGKKGGFNMRHLLVEGGCPKSRCNIRGW